ncbi:MAG: metalloregulator ArsR/SmtB family transcription factor [Acidimicrobiales bacterium]|nr:metalloregulator ArsR/SmtB family transcription factor [Acidimicrobiales bacterium]
MSVNIKGERSGALKSLADPARWEIVERLAAEELCVCHLVEELGLPQPLVSHHLKVLRNAGVVESERYKQWIYYRLNPEVLTDIGHELTRIAETVPPAKHRRRPCE